MIDEPRETPTHVPVERQLCDAAELAKILDVSVRTVYRLNDAGRIPAPIALGTCRRWRIEEVLEWIRTGAPPRRPWRNPA